MVAHIHFVIDSTAHIEEELLNRYPCLHVAPLTVRLGEQEYAELDLTAEAFLAKLEQRPELKRSMGTSQPAVGVLTKLFSELTADGSEVLVICLSEALSGTAQAARLAASEVAGNIGIVDSRTTAIGMVKLAEQGIALAEQGLNFEVIQSGLEQAAQATSTFFVPGTLEFLQRGGRIGKAASLVGALLKIRPVLYLVEGTVHVLDKVRTQTRAIQRMVDEIRLKADYEYIGIVHLGAMEQALSLQKQLQELYPNTAVSIHTVGSVLACHLGPGLVGVICQERGKLCE